MENLILNMLSNNIYNTEMLLEKLRKQLINVSKIDRNKLLSIIRSKGRYSKVLKNLKAYLECHSLEDFMEFVSVGYSNKSRKRMNGENDGEMLDIIFILKKINEDVYILNI